jgi:hypothetical protein
VQGPDYEGQIRRLRSGDGVYYTKFGARKIAHYVEREIQRTIAKGVPVALPVPVDPGAQAPNAKPGSPAQRPAAGPVVPLTALNAAPEELVGGGRAGASDAAASRALTKGEPVGAPIGRADDFVWPRGSARNAPPTGSDAAAPEPAPAPAPDAGAKSTADSSQADSAAEQKPAQRRPRRPNPHAQRPPFFFPNFFR